LSLSKIKLPLRCVAGPLYPFPKVVVASDRGHICTYILWSGEGVLKVNIARHCSVDSPNGIVVGKVVKSLRYSINSSSQ